MVTKTVKRRKQRAYIAAVGRRKTAVAQVRITPITMKGYDFRCEWS
jgi:ribosomal protein S9